MINNTGKCIIMKILSQQCVNYVYCKLSGLISSLLELFVLVVQIFTTKKANGIKFKPNLIQNTLF